ncbi:MAG: IS1 family transposase [Clostridiaceae bacterium]
MGYESFIKNIIKIKHKDGIHCPDCNSENIYKHGKYRGRQRYICKDCSKSFNDLTGTILSGTHNINKWIGFLDIMQERNTLRETSKKLGIAHTTIFYWRHKMLRSLNYDDKKKYDGLVEVFQHPYPLIDKNPTHHYQDRRMKTCQSLDAGDAFFPRFCNKVSFILTYEPNGRIVSNILEDRARDSKYLDYFKSRMGKNNTFCLWFEAPLSYVLKKESRKNKNIKVYSRNDAELLFNANHAFKFYRSYLSWQNDFKGVSTKYLTDYIAWYKNLTNFNFTKSATNSYELIKETFKSEEKITNWSVCLSNML